jgi:hypothetical protein
MIPRQSRRSFDLSSSRQVRVLPNEWPQDSMRRAVRVWLPGGAATESLIGPFQDAIRARLELCRGRRT